MRHHRVTDQLAYGIVGAGIRACLSEWAERGKIVVVDSRDRIGMYAGFIFKPNEVEASRA